MPTETDSLVIVVPSGKGLIATESIQTNKQVEGVPNEEYTKLVPFWKLEISVSKLFISLPKNMLIAVSTETPETIISYDELAP